MEKFDGLTLHSRDYRKPETLKDRTVLVFGAGDSGTDIAIEIAPFATKVMRFAPINTRSPQSKVISIQIHRCEVFNVFGRAT